MAQKRRQPGQSTPVGQGMNRKQWRHVRAVNNNIEDIQDKEVYANTVAVWTRAVRRITATSRRKKFSANPIMNDPCTAEAIRDCDETEVLGS